MDMDLQTVPVFENSVGSPAIHTLDFDVILRDSQVPSPSDLYASLYSSAYSRPEYDFNGQLSLGSPDSGFYQTPSPVMSDCYKSSFDQPTPGFNIKTEVFDDSTPEYRTDLQFLDTYQFDSSPPIHIKSEPIDYLDSEGEYSNNISIQALIHTQQDKKCQFPTLIAALEAGDSSRVQEGEWESPGDVLVPSQEIVNDLMMDGLQAVATEEAMEISRLLAIPADPARWTVDDVRHWMSWTVQQNHLDPVQMQEVRLDGASLCQLKEDELRHHIQASPRTASFLLAKLTILTFAASQCPKEPKIEIENPPSVASVMVSSPASPVYNNVPATFRPEESVADISGFVNWPVVSGNAPTPSGGECFIPAEESTAVGSPINPEQPSSVANSAAVDYSSDEDISEDSGDTVPSTTGDSPGPPVQGTHSNIHLWQFLKELLLQPQTYGSCIRWIDRSKSVFKIEDSVRVARLWGIRKNRPAMNYDKLSRSIRQYYKKGIMRKTERSQRLVYQFCAPYGV